MRIFLSYSSADRSAAELIAAALQQGGHDVFFDQSALHPGEGFHAEIRRRLEDCELFLFLVSPQAVDAGSYTLTELDLVEKRPGVRLLPVELAPTDMDTIPASLRTVGILRARGNLAADVEAEVARVARGVRRRRWLVAGLAAGAVAVVGAALVLLTRSRSPTLSGPAQQALQAAEVQRKTGDYAGAWRTLAEVLAREPALPPLEQQQEQLAMAWLRDITVNGDRGATLADVREKIRPALSRGIAAGRPYAADLWAHLGWTEYLLSKQGMATRDPAESYREALGLDPDNSYAHAMLGHWRLVERRPVGEALEQFDAALRTGRDPAFTYALAFAGLAYYDREELEPEVLKLANTMRQGPLRLHERDARAVRTIYHTRLLDDRTADLTAAVEPADLLATFDWAVAEPEGGSGGDLHRFCRSRLLELAGRGEEALAGYRQVLQSLDREKSWGRLRDQATRALGRLGPPGAGPPRQVGRPSPGG